MSDDKLFDQLTDALDMRVPEIPAGRIDAVRAAALRRQYEGRSETSGVGQTAASRRSLLVSGAAALLGAVGGAVATNVFRDDPQTAAAPPTSGPSPTTTGTTAPSQQPPTSSTPTSATGTPTTAPAPPPTAVAGPPTEALSFVPGSAAISGATLAGKVINHTWGVELLLDATGLAVGASYRVVYLDTDDTTLEAGGFVGTAIAIHCRCNAALLRPRIKAIEIRDSANAVVSRAQF